MSEIKGDQFSGNWHHDKKHGFGKYVWSDGDAYEGQWECDLRSGEGTCTYSNGDKYTGEWHNDMRHGWGRLAWSDGNTYEGCWKDDNISPGTKGIVRSGASTRAASRDTSVTHSPRNGSVASAMGPKLSPTPEAETLREGVSEVLMCVLVVVLASTEQ